MDADSGQSGNRLFIIIAAALIGLICIGLVGLGGAVVLIQANRAQEEAALQPTATSTPVPPTPTHTATPTNTATNTPPPTPTGTLVVGPTSSRGTQAPENGPPPQSTATSTPILGSITATPPANTSAPLEGGITPAPVAVPSSGGVLPAISSSSLGWLASGLLVVLLLYGLFYRARPG